jgi:hypothetical protein
MEELTWNTEDPENEGLYICYLGPYMMGVQLGHWDGSNWLFDNNTIRQVFGWIKIPKYKQKDND